MLCCIDFECCHTTLRHIARCRESRVQRQVKSGPLCERWAVRSPGLRLLLRAKALHYRLVVLLRLDPLRPSGRLGGSSGCRRCRPGWLRWRGRGCRGACPTGRLTDWRKEPQTACLLLRHVSARWQAGCVSFTGWGDWNGGRNLERWC